MGRIRRAARREHGSSAVEFIVVLSVLALIVVALAGSGLHAQTRSSVRGTVCDVLSAEGDALSIARCGGGGSGVAAPAPPEDGAPAEPAQPVSDTAPQGPPAPGDEPGGFWAAGGAFLDGLLRGDFNRDDRTGNAWVEGARGVGQFLSGVLIVGDIRDGSAAVEEIWSSGGRDGWGNLLLSGVGLVPLAGDAIKGVRGTVRVVDDVAAAADDVPRPRNPADEAAPARPPDCLTNSFAPATRVLLADGTTVPIADVDVGDEVLAADPVSGAVGARAVTHLIVGLGVKELVDVTLGGATLTATGGHPFYLPEDGGWVDAGDLRPGDRLRTAAGGQVVVEAVRERRAVSVAHNLSVADLHTYHVVAGGTGVLVHNQSGGGPCFPSWGDGTGPRTLPPRAPFDDPDVAREVNATLDRVQGGGPHPYPNNDHRVYTNDGRGGSARLPARGNNYYREYTVETPVAGNRGQRRIIVGAQGEVYYSHEHYRDFERINPRRAPR